LQEAAAEKDRFLASLPKLRAFLDQVVKDCRSSGEPADGCYGWRGVSGLGAHAGLHHN